MKGSNEVTDIPELSEVRRALLEKYLDEKRSQSANTDDNTREEVTTLPDGIVALQPHGYKQPFFFLHGQWNGNAFYCFPISQELGLEQPFYTLEPYKFDCLKVPSSFETIAATHLKLLEAVQPEGPYLLGGWCNGALVAYEMARQLHARGKEIRLLVLMDPVTLVYPARVRFVRSIIRRFGSVMKLSQEKQLELFLRIRHLYRYIENLNAHVSSRFRRSKSSQPLQNVGSDKMGNPLPELRSMIPTTKELHEDYPGIFDWIAMGYKPDLYPGKITIFWSQHAPFRAGWRKVLEVNDVEIHSLPGTHITCRTEYLNVLTEHLNDCLGKAQPTQLS